MVMYAEFPSSSISLCLVPNALSPSRGNVSGVSIPFCGFQPSSQGWVAVPQSVSAVMCKPCSVCPGKAENLRRSSQRQFLPFRIPLVVSLTISLL